MIYLLIKNNILSSKTMLLFGKLYKENNMKKIFLILLVIASTFSLSACGRDTKDWSRISLPFEREAINQIEISHFENEKRRLYYYKKRNY